MLSEILADCKWGPWDAWKLCTKTCGGGSRTKMRKIVQLAVYGGEQCNGSNIETEICNEQICPGRNEFVKLARMDNQKLIFGLY